MIARILVLQEIDRERSRQELLKAQGKFRHTAADAIPPDRAFAILTEEVGEVARELNDAAAAGRAVDPSRLAAELVQTAAVAVAWLEQLQAAAGRPAVGERRA